MRNTFSGGELLIENEGADGNVLLYREIASYQHNSKQKVKEIESRPQNRKGSPHLVSSMLLNAAKSRDHWD